MEKVSLWIRGAKVWNAYEKKFEEADVAVEKGRFCYIDRERRTFLDAERILDAAGLYLLPGIPRNESCCQNHRTAPARESHRSHRHHFSCTR